MDATSPTQAFSVIVFGADWCEDTRRSRRLLRRLSVRHDYRNIDEDLDALEEATRLNHGVRRTPVLALGGQVLVEPSNETLSTALVGQGVLTADDVRERLDVQNVGDVERLLRVGSGAAVVALARRAPGSFGLPMGLLGAGLLITGVAGFCPVYRAQHVSSIGGPGDRPDEAEHTAWLRHLEPSQ